MGIGNTTPATALACWLTGDDPPSSPARARAWTPGHRRKAEIIARRTRS